MKQICADASKCDDEIGNLMITLMGLKITCNTEISRLVKILEEFVKSLELKVLSGNETG
jgi:hypothetical protein